MLTNRLLTTALTLLSTAACNPFQRGQAVRMSAEDTELNTRWHANLVSPASLAGVVQMNGLATMEPAPDGTRTIVTLSLTNAAPGGSHPWEVRLGECGMATDHGVFGLRDEYEGMTIGSDGRANASATVSRQTPVSGGYFLAVYASDENRMVVACGNMASPTS